MSCSSKRIRERGVALLVAMFTLVLLSVVGLGLMYSTNMETFINANYRDKQLAMYAALSGVQEARDRLQPANPDIPLPTALPTLTNHQVIYIINPQPGETVAPWDSTNKYMDTELCQEGILGLTPTPGVPCAALPSGSDWYTVIDNSDSSQAPWNLATPLDVKWTRVTLKGNNMTPVLANGSSSTVTQTCWEGGGQILRPAGYGATCGPDGSIATVTVTSGGLGYTSAPTVTFAAPPSGGTQATGTATIAQIPSGQLSSIAVTDDGAGYTSAPAVSFTGGGGTGATATATIVAPGSPVASVSLATAGGQCYAVPPTVSFAGGGSGATASATLDTTRSCVSSWTVTGSCSSRKGTTATGVSLSGGSGSGFSGSVTFANGTGNVTAVSIQDPGNGYTSNPTGIVLTGCGSLTLTAVAGYRPTALTLTNGGTGYTSVPTVSVSSGAGTAVAAPTGTATLGPAAINAGTVSAINLNNPGSGYSSVPSVVLSGGGAGVTTVATGTASLATTYTVTGITLTDPGLAYLANPTVTFSGGGGTGAAATAARAKGWTFGQIFLVTSMAQTASGARAMAQGEIASPVLGASFPGALTLDGPNPVMDNLPNSNPFHISGVDLNSCGETAEPAHPAIGGFDDPNAEPPTASVQTIINAIPSGRQGNYVGEGGTPSVQNVYGALGETMRTPWGLKALIDAVAGAPGAHVYGNNPSSIALGTAASPAVNYVDGNLTLSGSTAGYGILVVTGTLTMSGSFAFNGIILNVGDGRMEYNGGGNPQINGTVLVANIWDNFTNKNLHDSLGSPYVDWDGGGGNGIYYDHCLVDNMISMIPFTPPPTTQPLKMLSKRTVTY